MRSQPNRELLGRWLHDMRMCGLVPRRVRVTPECFMALVRELTPDIFFTRDGFLTFAPASPRNMPWQVEIVPLLGS